MDMDGGSVGTGAAPWFPGGGRSLWPPADDEVVHKTKAAPSTSYFKGRGGGGFVRNGTTPSPSPSGAAAFAAAALTASYCPIPPGDIHHGGHRESNDPPQQHRTHDVYAPYPPASTNWGIDGSSRNYMYDYGDCYHGQRLHLEPWQATRQGFEDNREERAETVGRDGGSAGARGNGDENPAKRQAMMHVLELELLERAQDLERTAIKSTMATSLPVHVTHGSMAFPPSPRDPVHLLQESRRDNEAITSFSANPGRLVGVPIGGSKGPTVAIRRRRRGNTAQEREQTFSPVKHSEEQYHHPDRNASFGMCEEPSRSRTLGVAGPTAPRNEKRNVGNRCQHPGCMRRPSFGPRAGAKIKVYCTAHKPAGMVKITSRQCTQDTCLTAPSYGFQGKKASFCSKHKMPGMVNVVTPRCQKDGCASCASYGNTGRRPMFCARHAHDGMSNVVSRKCLGAGCLKSPSYGHPGDRRASFCVDHHLSGMANVVSPKCLAPGCGKVPSFGESGDRKASWCKSHKRGGMVSVFTSLAIEKAGCVQ